MDLPYVRIFSDGSYRKLYNRGGYAGLMYHPESNSYQLVYGNQVGASNDNMELYAAIRAISFLTTPCNVEVVSDSMYVVQTINSYINGWADNDWRSSTNKPLANVDLIKQLWDLMHVHQIKATWVKGHQKNPTTPEAFGNSVVDYFAASASEHNKW